MSAYIYGQLFKRKKIAIRRKFAHIYGLWMLYIIAMVLESHKEVLLYRQEMRGENLIKPLRDCL